MWNRIVKRLEIIGYARAIGAMKANNLVNEAKVCEASREQAIADLKRMKLTARRDPSRTYMRGTARA